MEDGCENDFFSILGKTESNMSLLKLLKSEVSTSW